MTKGKESKILTKEIMFFPHVFYFSFILVPFLTTTVLQRFNYCTLSEKRIVRYVPNCIFIIIQRDKNGYAS